MTFMHRCIVVLISISLLGLQTLQVSAQEEVPPEQITFEDIARNAESGIQYGRVPSASDAEFTQFKLESLNPATPYTFEKLLLSPLKSRGAPGTALLDFDGDGDLDIYVTNGPGASNSLFSNQLADTGNVTFVDVADEVGIGATDQDSTGVCYGDIDNDGDEDVLVLGNTEPNRLFVNDGGQFTDVTAMSGLGIDSLSSTSCSMGDVNGDGLLDIAVVNNFDMTDQFALIVEPFALNQPNQLFVNVGENVFEDVSASSGIQQLAWDIPLPPDTRTLTWAVAMVDYDLDGDVDIFMADDQAGIQPAYVREFPGVPVDIPTVDRGYIRVLNNDGSGAFTDVTFDVNMNQWGAWMGFAFGDLNHDGQMDVFATNFGGYATQNFGGIFTTPSDFVSRWFLGQPDGSFDDPGVGDLIATPFGWGTAALDLENDGDTDIIFHGGHDVGPFIDASTSALLENDGAANFGRNESAFANSTDHTRRIVHGLSTGDLNQDGFVDIVTVANMDAPEPLPIVQYNILVGSPFDRDAFFVPTFASINGPGTGPPFAWTGFELPNGSLSVEMNSANSGNHALSVRAAGTAGITSDGAVNRDGIGAVILVTPLQGQTAMSPVLGGSSYASQHELTQHFGLGSSNRADVDILWPGGVRNKLYHAHAGTTVLFPEVPCSYDGEWENLRGYTRCVRGSLMELHDADVINLRQLRKLYVGAIVAYFEHQYGSKGINATSVDSTSIANLFVKIDGAGLEESVMVASNAEFDLIDQLLLKELDIPEISQDTFLPRFPLD